ncbi:MAG: DUF2849 domain-containing protein [Devosia sp.]
MARNRPHDGPSILTANDLLSGAIVFWTGHDWSTDQGNAVRANPADRDTLTAVGTREEAENRVVGADLVALDAATGTPVHLRERQRLGGPSIALPLPPARRAA